MHNFYNFSIWLGGEPPLQLFENMAKLYSSYKQQFSKDQNAIIPLVILDPSAVNSLLLQKNIFSRGFITLLPKEDLVITKMEDPNFISNILQTSTIKDHISHVLIINSHGNFNISYIPIICFDFQQSLIEDYHTTLISLLPDFKYQSMKWRLLPFTAIDRLLQKHKFVAAADRLRLLMLVILKNALYCDITKISPAIGLTPRMIDNCTSEYGTGITAGSSCENQSIFSTDVNKALIILVNTCYPFTLEIPCPAVENNEPISYQKPLVSPIELEQINVMLCNFRTELMSVIASQINSVATFKQFVANSGSITDSINPELLNKWREFNSLSIDEAFSRYSVAMTRNRNPQLYNSLIKHGLDPWGSSFKGTSSHPALSFHRNLIYSGEKIYQQRNIPTESQQSDPIYLSVINMLARMQQSLGITNINIIDMESLAEYAYKIYNQLEINYEDDCQISLILKNTATGQVQAYRPRFKM